MTNRTRLVSGRVPTSNAANVSPSRYQFLDLSSAEPNLGTGNTGDILTYNSAFPGGRKWVAANTIQSGNTQPIYDEANAAYSLASSSANTATNAYNKANSANVLAQAAFNAANAAGSSAFAQAAFNQANSANVLAQAAYNYANTSVQLSGTTQTISSNVVIQGSLQVTGNVTYTGNVTNVLISGNTGEFFGNTTTGFGALYAGIPTNFTVEPQTVQQITGNYNNYIQVNIQNINSGNNASGDLVVTADNGTANDTYIDLGINSSTYNQPGFGLTGPNDAYLYAYGNTTTGGGNLVLSTYTNKDIIFSTNGGDTPDEVMRITAANNVVIKSTNASNSTTTGALQVKGGASVQGNVYTGAVFANGFFYNNGVPITNVANSAAANTIVLAAIANSQNANILIAQAGVAAANSNISFLTGFSQSSYNEANGAFSFAQAAYNAANAAGSSAFVQAAFNEANGAFGLAQAAYNQANTAITNTNIIAAAETSQNANIAIALAGVAAANANIGYLQVGVTAAYNQANSASLSAINAFGMAQAAYNEGNTANVLAQSAYNQANSASANTIVLSAVNTAQNSNISIAQAGVAAANANLTLLFAIDNAQNTNVSIAQAGVAAANANISFLTGFSQSAFNQANAANVLAQAAFNAANSASGASAFSQAAFNQANVAGTVANTAVQRAGDTITGTLNVANLITTGKTITVGANTTWNTNSQLANSGIIVGALDYKSNSIFFNGSSDSLTLSPGFVIDGNPYTVEFWLYLSSNNITSAVGIIGTNTTSAFNLRLNSNTQIQIDDSFTSSQVFTIPTLQSNTWYHIAAVRDLSNRETVFVNGTRSSTGYVTDTANFTGTTNEIAADLTVTNYTPYLSNIRVVSNNNVYDPTQSTITVPTSILGTVTGTVYLGAQYGVTYDASGTQTVGTNGSPQSVFFSPFYNTPAISLLYDGANNWYTYGGITANNFYSNNINVLGFAQAAFNQANSAVVASGSGYVQAAFNQANAANVLAQSAYNQANAANVLAQASYVQANITSGIANSTATVANSASSNTVITQAIDVSQNANISIALAGVAAANANISFLMGSYTQANAANVLAQAAFNKANTLLPNVGSTITVNSSSLLYVANTAQTALTVAGGAAIGNLTTSYITATGNVLPGVDNTYYLGQPGQRWHTVYVGPGSVDINGIVLGNTSSVFQITNASDIQFIPLAGQTPLPPYSYIATTANSGSANTVITQAINISQNSNIAIALAGVNAANANLTLLFAIDTATNTNVAIALAGVNAANANISFLTGFSQGAYNQANTAFQNSQYSQGVDNWQNNQIVITQAGLTAANANLSFLTGFSQGAYTEANGAFGFAQAAYNAANSAGSSALTQAAFNQANVAGIVANTTAIVANSTAIVANIVAAGLVATNTNTAIALAGVVAANANISYALGLAQGAYGEANATAITANVVAAGLIATNTNTSILFAIANSQNANISIALAGVTAANANISFATGLAQGAYGEANATAITANIVSAGLVAANANVTLLFAIANSQNANISIALAGVTAANANISYALGLAQGAYGEANATSLVANVVAAGLTATNTNTAIALAGVAAANANIAIAQAGVVAANANLSFLTGFSQGAYNKANGSVQLTGVTSQTISSNVTIQGSLTVTGNVTYTGNVTSVQITGNTGSFFGYAANGFNALYAGLPTGYAKLPNEIAEFAASNNSYVQINQQNETSGTQATTDWVATADNGSDTTFFVDLGIASSGYVNTNPNNSLGTSLLPNDSYLYAQGGPSVGLGGNLVIGAVSTNAYVSIIAGGINSQNVVAQFTPTTQILSVPLTFSDSTVQSTAAAPLAYTQAGFNAANTAASNTVVLTAGLRATNTNVAIALAGVSAANANIAIAQAGVVAANANISYAIGLAQGAYGEANATAITANVVAAGLTATNTNTAIALAGVSAANANIAIAQAGVVAANANISYAIGLSQGAYGEANATAIVANVVAAGLVATNTNTSIALAGVSAANTNLAILFAIANSQNANISIALAGVTAANANIAIAQAGVVAANANISFLTGFSQGAYNQANSANVLAQAAFNAANLAVSGTGSGYVQAAFNQANVASGVANSTAIVANSAYTLASTALQNTANILVPGNFTISGNLIVPYIQTSGAGGNITGANTVYSNTVNTITLYATSIYSNGQLVVVGAEPIANIVSAGLIATNTNVAIALAGVAAANANISFLTGFSQGAYTEANGAFGLAQAAYNAANAAGSSAFVQAAFNQANVGSGIANSTAIVANSTAVVANIVAAGLTATNTNTAIALAGVTAANANINLLFAIDNAQNTNINVVQAGLNAANANLTLLFAIDNATNTNVSIALAGVAAANANISYAIGLAQGAYGEANATATVANSAYNSTIVLAAIANSQNANIAIALAGLAAANANISTSVSQSGWTSNTIIFANSGGYLSNTTGLKFYSSNSTTISQGTIIVSGATGQSAIIANGYNQRGGTGYQGFLEVTNQYSGATNPSKFFRLDSSGNFQIRNATDTQTIFQLSDAGEVALSADIKATYIQFGDGSQQWTANAGSGIAQAAWNQANSANVLAQAAFNKANTGGGSSTRYTTATTPPSSSNNAGDQWYNTATDTLYEYTTSDGTYYYWIDIQSPTASSNAITFTGVSAGRSVAFALIFGG